MTTSQEIAMLIEAASSLSGFPESEFTRKGRRNKDSSQWRFAMWALLRFRGMSYPKIAKHFNCHYTTVVYGVDKIEDKINKDKHMQSVVTALIKHVKLPAPQKKLI